MPLTSTESEKARQIQQKLLAEWKSLLDLFTDKQSSADAVLNATRALQATIEAWFSLQGEGYSAEDKLKLILELAQQYSVTISDTAQVERFHHLKNALLGVATPSELRKQFLLSRTVTPVQMAVFQQLGTTLGRALDNGINLPNITDKKSFNNNIAGENYVAIQQFFFSEHHPELLPLIPLEKQIIALNPYHTAFIQSLSYLSSDPEKVLRAARLLYQQLMAVFPELATPDSDEAKRALQLYLLARNKVNGDEIFKEYMQLQDALTAMISSSKQLEPETLSALQQSALLLNQFADHGLSSTKKPQSPTASSSNPGLAVANIALQAAKNFERTHQLNKQDIFAKATQRFRNHHRNLQLVQQAKNPFTSFPFTLTQLKDFLTTHEQKSRLPINFVAEYLLTHPDETKDYLDRRKIIGLRNYRQQFCKNPELLHLLIDRGNSTIREAIAKSGILASTHLSEKDKKILQDKLTKALAAKQTVADNPVAKDKADVHNYIAHLTAKVGEAITIPNTLDNIQCVELATALKQKINQGLSLPEADLQNSIANINQALAQGPLTAVAYKKLIYENKIHVALNLDNALFPTNGFTKTVPAAAKEQRPATISNAADSQASAVPALKHAISQTV